MAIMKAICLVAHPDDCVIFAWPYIEAHCSFKWVIVYLTYTADHPRAKELSAFWNSKNIDTRFLGFADDWQYVKDQKLGFDSKQAQTAVINSLDCDLILTHGPTGEYGHPHHVFLHNAVKDLNIDQVYFSNATEFDTQLTVTESINPLMFPLHQEVIESFLERDTGFYINKRTLCTY